MSKLRVHCFSISLDGYGAGADQSLDNPLDVGGEALHEWVVATRTFRRMSGQDGGSTGTDDEFTARSFANVGASILGRNMFGPIRGPWPDDAWKGWWGDSPPYHTPVFVLTNHARAPVSMQGGTAFHFVTNASNTFPCRTSRTSCGQSAGDSRVTFLSRRYGVDASLTEHGCHPERSEGSVDPSKRTELAMTHVPQ